MGKDRDDEDNSLSKRLAIGLGKILGLDPERDYEKEQTSTTQTPGETSESGEGANQIISQNQILQENEEISNLDILFNEKEYVENMDLETKSILDSLSNIKRGLEVCTNFAYKYSGLKTYKQFVDLGDQLENLQNLLNKGTPIVNQTLDALNKANTGIVATGEALTQAAPIIANTTNTMGDVNMVVKTAIKPAVRLIKKEQRRKDRARRTWANFRDQFKTFSSKTKEFFNSLPANILKALKAPINLITGSIEGIQNLINKRKEHARPIASPRQKAASPHSPSLQNTTESPRPQTPHISDIPENQSVKSSTEVKITRRPKQTSSQNHPNSLPAHSSEAYWRQRLTAQHNNHSLSNKGPKVRKR